MRKRLLLTAICVLSVMMSIAQNNRTNPDVADYFIKGNLSIERGSDGKLVYKLSEIDNQGIYFDNPRATRVGKETDFEDVLFQFSHASTNYSGGINTPLDFWRYDKDIHEWQPDGETHQSNASVEDKKSMAVMLVLDCSSSIGDDFAVVQEAANAFIESLYEASKGAGNIKLGIVSFSKINESLVFNIRPLTSESYNEMTRFINRLSTQNGTALYYAMDKSVELMEDYCRRSISSSEPLSAAVMVTFTDGLDQTSRDPDKDILTAEEYYDEVLSKYGTKMQKVSINGVSLQHEIRGVKGNDIITDAQLGKFQRTGESLGNFMRLNNYSELGAAFGDIAQNLIDQWRVLNLYVPNSFSGRVAWTYPSRKPVVVEKPKEPKEPRKKGRWFFGLNAGLGISKYYRYEVDYYQREYGGSVYNNTWYDDELGLAVSGGLDIAFPIGRAVNLGLFASVGYETADQSLLLNAGPLILINFRKGSSLYLGGGVSSVYFDSFGTDWRVGFKFKNGLYLFGELFSISYDWSQERSFYIIDGYNYNYYGYDDYGHYIYRTDTYEKSLKGLLFHIGYSF